MRGSTLSALSTSVARLLLLTACSIAPSAASAQTIIEIIDQTGDGGGNTLDAPLRIAVDGAGNVYVAGRLSDNAFKIEPNGTITQIIDATGDGVHSFVAPAGVAVDGSGNAYVSGRDSDNAFKIEPNGTITQIIDFTGDGEGLLYGGGPVTADGEGNVYALGGAGGTGARAFKIEPNGTITVILHDFTDGEGHPLRNAIGVAVDGAGNVYVMGNVSNNVFKIEPDGTITQIIDDTGDGESNFKGGTFLAVDDADNVYVTGRQSDNAFMITPALGIDVKPGSDTNPIRPTGRGVIPVAILGSDIFDVADLDLSTLAFGPDGAAPLHPVAGHLEDVNNDGLTDLVSHYQPNETGISIGDTEACVTVETLDGIPRKGCDFVRAVQHRPYPRRPRHSRR